MERKSWSNNEMAAMAGLVAAWDEIEMGRAEMAATLVEQVDGNTQGWDHSMEDAEDHPELAALVGLDPWADPGTDEEEERWEAAAEAWGRVVAEAARRWLAAHPEEEEEARAGME